MSMTSNFKLDIDADGIALVTWDMPGRSMNVIDLEVIEELAAHRREGRGRRRDQGRGHHLRQGDVLRRRRSHHARNAEPRVRRRRAKRRARRRRSRMLFEESRKLSQLYRRLETCGKPWVAAINGTALGGGFELCLACHHRIAADNPKTRVGLPEIKIGLFPGAGGTQRIARMMPPGDALQFLLKGDQLRLDARQGDEARRCGRAGRRSRQGRQGLDQGRRQGRRRRGTSTASGCRAGRSIPRPA